jgi:MFS transporter, DHA2 family, methylenomycin A resistance protein
MPDKQIDQQKRDAKRHGPGALMATSIGFAVIQLDVTVVNVAIRQIGRSFGTGVAALQWIVGAYTLTFAALMLTAGALGDRFGTRRVFTTGFVVFVLASMACGLAPTVGVLIAARAIQGCGAALLGACSLALLNHAFRSPKARSWALAWWAAGGSAALSGGPVVGGALIATVGWRGIFFINLPIGTIGVWLTSRCLTETPLARERRLDLAGSLLVTVALTALAASLIEAGSLGLGNARVVAGLALAIVAGLGFALREARTSEPMLPLSLFGDQRFTLPAAIGMLVNLCFYGLIFIFSLLFQTEHGLTALQTGLAFVPMTAAILAANLLTGRLTDRIGAPRSMMAGIVTMAIGCAGLLWLDANTPLAIIIAAQALLGGGLGLLVPPMTGTLMTSVDRSRSGVAAGALTTMRQTGSLLGVALFGSLLTGAAMFYSGLHLAAAISIVLLAAGAVLCLLLRHHTIIQSPTKKEITDAADRHFPPHPRWGDAEQRKTRAGARP